MAQPNYEADARRFARKYGIDPNVFVRQIRAESGFNPRAVSRAGAQGIAQIMPSTAKSWGVNPNDPRAALKAAAQHMAGYSQQYGGIRNALVAYNAGAGNVGKALPKETQDYVSKILGGSPGLTSSSRPSPSVPDTGGDYRKQIALSLLGMGNLGGDYGSDPLTTALLQAKAGRAAPQQNAQPSTGSASGNIIELGKLAQKMGLHVGENPAFGTVHHVHAPDSWHYKGRAIDVSGDPALMARYANAVAGHYGKHLLELFWQGKGGVDIKNGKRVAQGFVSGHKDHVHVAI